MAAPRKRKPVEAEEPTPVEAVVEVVDVPLPKPVLGIDGKNPITPNNPPAKAQ